MPVCSPRPPGNHAGPGQLRVAPTIPSINTESAKPGLHTLMRQSSIPRRQNSVRVRWDDLQRRSSKWTNRLPPAVLQTARDRYLWALLIVALVVNLGLFAYLIFEFSREPPVLPPLVPLHFDASGEPDRIESRNVLFSLAQIGLIVIVGNLGLGALMYRRERLAAYLLSASSIVVQLLLWFAAIQILRFVAL